MHSHMKVSSTSTSLELFKDNSIIENHASKKRKVQDKNLEKRVVKVKIEAKRGDEQKTKIKPPADSWSWKKYGQKAISGSPYLRSYYRCNSEKGCPARRQVERCKEDDSILIITYTTAHNHPSPISQSPNLTKNHKAQKKAQVQGSHSRPKPKLENVEHPLHGQGQFHNVLHSPTYDLGENEEEPYFVSLDTSSSTPYDSQHSVVMVDELPLGDLPDLKSLSTSNIAQENYDFLDDLDELNLLKNKVCDEN